MDRVAVTERALLEDLAGLEGVAAPTRPDDADEWVRRFDWMVTSRALDVVARTLKAEGRGYYTIASAGHEWNVLVGAALRADDPALLHYRSGAFMQARLRHDPDADPITDVVRSFSAAADDPVARGRHKVWGSASVWVPPQTSTIASQLPKAVGMAFAVGRHAGGGLSVRAGARVPADDAVVVTSFGDASLNHATALSAINAARYARRRGQPVPILFVCEDNGLGISVETPPRWVEETVSGLAHLDYLRADGDPAERRRVVEAAVRRCREARTPVFLHLPCVRLWGHAGSDVEAGYRDHAAILADEALDPLRVTATWLVRTGRASARELQDLVLRRRDEVAAAGEEHGGGPTLVDASAVMATLAPYDEARVRDVAAALIVDDDRRRAVHGGRLPEEERLDGRRTMAAHLNAALHDLLHAQPAIAVFGEDVGRKGGVYGVTSGLQAAHGHRRVFDSLLDETTILGVAQGLALAGALPVPEIQYLAYLHNALDQLRGEAASTSFFSDGAWTTPMVVRVAGLAYQKGFGGHFHNDNSIGALRDIPGLVVATPSRGDDAVRMLRGLVAMAVVHGQVSVFLEPIARYHDRDLFEPGDGHLLTDHPPPGAFLLPGEVGVHAATDDGTRVTDGVPDDRADVLVVTWGNGVGMSLRARRASGRRVRVLDLRWLLPLPHEAVRAHADTVSDVLVVDEGRRTGGGIADEVIARLVETGWSGRLRSVRSHDSFVPLGPAADHVLLTEDDVVAALAS